MLAQVAAALPADVRGNVIIIGSLAAGYHFFSGDGGRAIRTKDVDCLFSPHSKAIAAAAEVADQLIRADWKLREGPDWSQPGKTDDEEKDLPMVRLRPPGEAAASWFLELLSAPPAFDPGAPGKNLRRVETSIGHFAICSFAFLALAEWRPLDTAHGVRIARPEMMALANLLHHPAIGAALIAGTDWNRSNKDLGRVLALAYLAIQRDRRDGTAEFDAWAERMWRALQDKFGGHAPQLAARAGAGMSALLASPADLNQALRIANLGLLASMDVSLEAFRATGARFMVEVIDELEQFVQ
ncbi:hypothetical protein [Rubrivivax gelatinosus]|uniref:hypothetical protein n=1 Tax=Rubrivivax gelatinosus TaxID=28068 RepID=UPI0012FD79DB|nr:hypothetical protein [Rubrivivax gelatinosus]MBG6083133.1 hypothetical protein [Rubrivivax gelatinosus]